MPFAIACVVLLTSQAVALTETQPPMARPTSGQLDHFSYSMYLDDKTEDPRRLHLPHLRLRAPPAGALRKAAQAAPVIAAALTEIPAVREQLSEWLGRDVPAVSGVAKELLDLAQSEVRRLGDNLAETARQTSQAAQRKAKGTVKEAGDVVKETVKELDETVILAEHKAEELIHHKPPPPRHAPLAPEHSDDSSGGPQPGECPAEDTFPVIADTHQGSQGGVSTSGGSRRC